MNFSKRPLLLLRKHRRLGPVSLLVASLMTSSAIGATISHSPEVVVANPFFARPQQIEPQQTLLLASTIRSSQSMDWSNGKSSLKMNPAKTTEATLLRLPPVESPSILPTDESAAAPAVTVPATMVPATMAPATMAPAVAVPSVSLLPPRPIDTPIEADFFEIEISTPQPTAAEPTDPLSAATTGALTAAKVDELAQRKIRRGYALAERGAYYAARRELVEVLRLVSRSHDARNGVAQRSIALAEGLRALEEVEDFAPRGTQLEAEMDLDVVCASHRTILSTDFQTAGLLPQQMTSLYFRHAQLKLSESVSREPAGSMALHALGKLYSRLEQNEAKAHRLAHRHAVAFQQAALLAHSDNHLAAHELGVLLAQSGHFVEAEKLLSRVARREIHPVVLRNLARVQQEMGHTERAVATREHALRLAQAPDATHNNMVQWITPAEFSQAAVHRAQPATGTNLQPRPSAPPVPSSHSAPQPRPTWQTPMTANVGLRVAGKPMLFGHPPRTNRPASSPAPTMPPQSWR